MQLTNAIVAAILAFSSTAAAAPSLHGRAVTNGTATVESTPKPTQTGAPGLSLTQRLFLADTAADRYALLPEHNDFIFDFNQPQKNRGDGGELVVANRKTFPALVGTGSGMAVGRVDPCGLNTFHVHPRSAELQVVVEGRLITEMVPENGVLDKDGKRRVIRTELRPFQMTPFPQGSVHTQFNPDCSRATFVASFASEDAGAGQIADETFAFSDDLISAVLGQSIKGEDIDIVRKAIPASIAKGVEECLVKCKIPKRSI
jgi:hypothetical protein